MLTQVVETACGPVEYWEEGAGEAILYFHGTGVTGDVMLNVERPLVEDGFRLIVPNRPGYGQTPLAPHGSAAACANVAAALLDSLRIATASVMGSSGGAAFALAFAINHPDRVKSLVLLCPQLHRWDDKRWLPKTSQWTLPLLTHRFLRKPFLKLYQLQLRRMTGSQLLKIEAGNRYPEVAADPASQELALVTLEAMRRCAGFAGFENDFRIFINEDIVGSNDSMQIPTLVIHDAEDPLAPGHVDWFVSKFPTCETVCLHAGGHLIWVGRDADVMHESRVRFLKEYASRAT